MKFRYTTVIRSLILKVAGVAWFWSRRCSNLREIVAVRKIIIVRSMNAKTTSIDNFLLLYSISLRRVFVTNHLNRNINRNRKTDRRCSNARSRYCWFLLLTHRKLRCFDFLEACFVFSSESLEREEGSGETKKASLGIGFPPSCRDLLFQNVVFLEWHTSCRKLLLLPLYHRLWRRPVT